MIRQTRDGIMSLENFDRDHTRTKVSIVFFRRAIARELSFPVHT